MIDLHDSRTPELCALSTSALLGQYIEDVVAGIRERGQWPCNDAREERLTAIGCELNRRIPLEKP